MRCSTPECAHPAVVDQPYAGRHLCAEHFRSSVRERVRREVHRQAPRIPGGTLAVALSGGKDSAVTLHLLHELFGTRRGVELVALSIDEGIAGYRSGTLAQASELCRRLGVRHVVRSFQEDVGTTTDARSASRPEEIPCSYCGVWRRRGLNRAARDVGAERLALGFNLDDLAQTVLMNLARGEPFRLAQMAPHPVAQRDLVPRIAPLALVPEREVYLFARLEGIPFDHGSCPHASRAGRNVFREVVWSLEEELPGTRHALLRTREKLLPLLLAAEGGTGAPFRCERCGEPSSGARCRACEYAEGSERASPNPFMPAASGGAP